MKLGIVKENKLETRTALTPQTIKHYQRLNLDIAIEKDAGLRSHYADVAYQSLGAKLYPSDKSVFDDCDIILSITPELSLIKQLKPKTILIASHLDSHDKTLIDACLKQNITVFSLHLLPRISRAQNMDVLSSQASITGYRAVIDALYHYQKLAPMMMTAAGLIQPANVLILGAGVAGLQAIATAKRMGAVVTVFDVRAQAKEQVESLGASFVSVSEESFEGSGGYAAETTAAYQEKQQALIDIEAAKADIVITTALIPNKKAPILMTENTVNGMKPGSIIVDIATAHGGNCALSKPDKTIDYHGITIIGDSVLARSVPTTASDMLANNFLNFVKYMLPLLGLGPTYNDDPIMTNTLVTKEPL